MNIQPNIGSLFPKPPLVDPEALQLKQARRHMAFNFCFTLNYPNINEEKMRDCVQAYRRYNRIVEGAFGEVVRRKREGGKKGN